MRAVYFLVFVLTTFAAAHAEKLTAVVLNEEGRPADNATITVAAVFHSPSLRVNAKTNAEGYFEADLPQLRQSERYMVTVRWKNQGAEVLNARDASGLTTNIQGQRLPTMVIRLRAGGTLRGRVLQAEDDRPLAGTRLFLDSGEVLTSDADGAFEVSGVPMKGHSLIPVARGRVRQYVLFDTTLQPNAELELRLPRGAIIKGRITDEDGNPIPGAFFSRASSGNSLTMNGWNEVCGADGSFEYGGLSVERLFYHLNVSAPGYERQFLSSEVKSPMEVIDRSLRLTVSAPEILGLGDAKNETVDPEPSEGESKRRSITGTVQSDGLPVAGATVRWAALQIDPTLKPVTSDKKGKFSLTEVPPRPGAVLIVASGLAPRYVPLADDKDDVAAQLSVGVTYRGSVQSMAGDPVPGARIVPQIHCLPSGVSNPVWLDQRSTVTDAKGEFSISALPAEGVTFDVFKAGYREKQDLPLKWGQDNVVRLEIGGGVRGCVVDYRFDPVQNFKIRVKSPRVRNANEKSGSYSAGFDWYGISYTQIDGNFILTEVDADRWLRFIVSAPGQGFAIVDRVKTNPLDQLPAAEKLMIRLNPWVPLTVRVSEARLGKPVADALVSLLEDQPGLVKEFDWSHDSLWATRARTDAAGNARYAEPAGEDGTIVVTAPGYAMRRIAWIKGATDIAVTLDPAAAIQGEVRRSGELFTQGYAELVSTEKGRFNVDLGETGGRLRFDQLPGGDYQLSINDPNGESLHEIKLTLKTGETRIENLTIPTAQKKAPRRDQKKVAPN